MAQRDRNNQEAVTSCYFFFFNKRCFSFINRFSFLNLKLFLELIARLDQPSTYVTCEI